jgi:hypothetical protein
MAPIIPNNEDENERFDCRGKIAQWQKLKMLVLDSVSSPITKRVYNMALDEFYGWFQLEPRPGFIKATVSAWRVSLEARRLGSSSIIIRMSAIRKLAAEAADNGLLAPELAASISRVKSAKSVGIRVGNWLSVRQAQSPLNAPNVATARGLLDRAIIAVLLGCGLGRSSGKVFHLPCKPRANILRETPACGCQSGPHAQRIFKQLPGVATPCHSVRRVRAPLFPPLFSGCQSARSDPR